MKYFVSFKYSRILSEGNGHCVLEADKELLTEEGIAALRESLEKRNKARRVVILNIIPLKEE